MSTHFGSSDVSCWPLETNAIQSRGRKFASNERTNEPRRHHQYHTCPTFVFRLASTICRTFSASAKRLILLCGCERIEASESRKDRAVARDLNRNSRQLDISFFFAGNLYTTANSCPLHSLSSNPSGLEECSPSSQEFEICLFSSAYSIRWFFFARICFELASRFINQSQQEPLLVSSNSTKRMGRTGVGSTIPRNETITVWNANEIEEPFVDVLIAMLSAWLLLVRLRAPKGRKIRLNDHFWEVAANDVRE